MSKKRRKFTKEFKLQIVQEMAFGKTVAQASREHNISESVISKWRVEYEKDPDKAFSGNGNAASSEAKIAELERMIGRLTIENDLLKKLLRQAGSTDR